ncbi:WD40 repeat domain-containing protein [Aquimarina aquimarini]|uniref:WD40 repeat domain-containing protein n=1 Tax=Aquimarina aquimarini TaxID=1191734 RepID=UPI00131F0BCB|nr:hypothetical protein [Aquimarina aquimarini]
MNPILNYDECYALDISSKASLLAASGNDKKLKLINTNSNQELKQLNIGSKGRVLNFSPCGKMIISGYMTLVLWDLNSFKRLFSLKGHKHMVNGVQFSPDSKMIASVSGASYTPHDYTLRVWNSNDGKLIHKLKFDRPLTGIFWTKEKNILISSENSVIKVDLTNLKTEIIYEGLPYFNFGFCYEKNQILISDPQGFKSGVKGVNVISLEGTLLHRLTPDIKQDVTKSVFNVLVKGIDGGYIAGFGIEDYIPSPTNKYFIVVKWDSNGKEVNRIEEFSDSLLQAFTFNQETEILYTCDSKGLIKKWGFE